jgi:hypothetical protein
VNQPSPAVAPVAETATPAAMPSLEERIAGVNNDLDAATSESAGESGESAPPAVSAKAPLSPAPSDDAEQRAADRRARLEALSAKTRESVDRKAQQAAAEKMARDLETYQRRAEEAERQAASRVDVSQLDEAAFFALAEKRGIAPQKLGEWIRTAMTNPEKVAEAAALQATQRTYDPKLEAIQKENEALKARLDAFEASQAKQSAAAEEQRQTQAFLGMVAQSAERAPLAAKLLASDPDEFMQMASIAAPRVPGMGPEALLDAVEELLDGEGRKVAQKYATLYGLSPSQTPAPTTPTIRGAAKPNTVSNSLAQERASLVDEDDYARLPIEERAARLIKSM